MSRVKRGFKARRRRKKVLDRAKGFRGARHALFRTAIHVTRRADVFAYRDRRVRRREMRRLMIVRINAASRMHGLRYSEFMNGLKKAGIEVDRSALAEIAINDEASFAELVTQAKSALGK